MTLLKRQKKQKNLMCCLFILLGSFGIQNCFAGTLAENADLARVSNLLSATYPLIYAAEKTESQQARVKFRYDLLIKDIQGIQAGIAQKINTAQIEPQLVKPLNKHFLLESSR